MPILELILILVVIGVVMWLVNAYIPMDATIKKILNIAVVVVVVIWLIQLILPFGNLGNIRVGH